MSSFPLRVQNNIRKEREQETNKDKAVKTERETKEEANKEPIQSVAIEKNVKH